MLIVINRFFFYYETEMTITRQKQKKKIQKYKKPLGKLISEKRSFELSDRREILNIYY